MESLKHKLGIVAACFGAAVIIAAVWYCFTCLPDGGQMEGTLVEGIRCAGKFVMT